MTTPLPQPVAFIPPGSPKPIHATPFVWRDPSTLPARQWLYGRHLIRRFVSVTVAPGGVGKSSLTIAEAVAMAAGRNLLGEWVVGPLRVWVLNLEDPRDELERRVAATMLHHGIDAEALGGRLFVDSGRERGLCTAMPSLAGATINAPEVAAVVAEIEARGIDVLIVDPFVSSHRVNENDNGAIDLVAKEWGRVAERCNCAIELVHHTRKLGGEEASSESSRGAVALLGAARSARVLNRMTDAQKAEAGVSADENTYFSVDRDKANLAPPGKRLWRRMVSIDLGNGDSVGVAEAWEWPDDFDGVSVKDLLAVQNAISAAWADGEPPRASNQVKNGWAGEIVAGVLGLDAKNDKARVSRLLKTWVQNGALREVQHKDAKRNKRPCLEVGEWATE
ncbi:Regulatory protein RepA [Aliiroseovarius sp. xm-m-379]|uniref:AAA family ATPase n=1 Tax=unclassified Aliiroseovarius TaxID=2623558 RepID=UPI00156A3D90|nr:MULTISPECIES: helicase RepA family protein [unclassified Aliiroseovarius]NRP25266.1 Regulatory protein RepA [Aliiroseovarius sp. xm-m-379]NRP34065.1 Regulatory protein RepA [Aliiroseovarius sp. xm-a-104]NRP50756.1 Regulatory protein RepA [Aliiroseovarius sp. xm-m-354]NRQ05508.1 Regulatory protein RepA [Aliiroseovarius sp. xm-m-309]NRQ08713.1 Regulatory protein RepA [Aliiroseovarius sp. xm-v-201]